MGDERLQKILANAGIGSRRSCEALIADGRVSVNGIRATLGDKADPQRDKIRLDGELIQPKEAVVYILLNKPPGILSSVKSQGNLKTVLQLVQVKERVYPVGRLDVQSEGFLLLTNDGALTNRLTHPRYQHEKEYRVQVNRKPDREQLETWRRGVVLRDGIKTKPAQVWIEKITKQGTWLGVVLTEGRKRQIRETAQAVGLHVVRLIRIRMGSLELGDLPLGAWRYLTPQELTRLEQTSQPGLDRGGSQVKKGKRNDPRSHRARR